MSVIRNLATTLAVLFLAASLIAQSGAAHRDTAATTPVPAVATVPPSSTIAFESGATPPTTATMIVGGAELLMGAVVGGKAGPGIMVGEGGAGLVGFQKSLR